MSLRRSAVRADRASIRGFTLIELIITLVIAGLLFAIALPSMGALMVGDRLRVSGTDLMSALLVARSEAIKRNAQIAVQPAVTGDWTKGWVVAAVSTGEQYEKRNGLGIDVVVSGAPGSIVYDRNGRLAAVGTAKVQFADAHSRVPARCVAIDLSGLPRLSQGNCT